VPRGSRPRAPPPSTSCGPAGEQGIGTADSYGPFVSELFNLTTRKWQDVLDRATAGIAFVPWSPIATGDLAAPDSPVADIARELDATPSQVAPAWLLPKSPVVLPIPGTKSLEHLRENLDATGVVLSAADIERLDAPA